MILRHKLKVLGVSFLVMITSFCFAQDIQKGSVYIYFKPDSTKGIFKVHRGGNQPDAYDAYFFYKLKNKKGKDIRYGFATFEGDKSKNYADSSILKKTRTISELDNIWGFGYYTSDTKRFPFKRVYIVEYISPWKYQVVSVQSYMGSLF